MTPSAVPGATVGYLTKRFPRLSETFILDEIIGLERAGVPLRLFAVADPHEDIVQPDVSRVSSPATYLRARRRSAVPRVVAKTLAAHLRLAIANPSLYRKVLVMALADRARTNTIRPFLDAGVLAVELRRARAVHLHAAFAHGPATTAQYVHYLTGIPFTFAAHAKDLYLSDANELASKAADAAFVLTCSAAARNGLMERLGSTSKVLLAYHGVDTGRFAPKAYAPSHQADPGGDRTLNILAVGRLVPKKGYPVVLRALSLLVDEGYTLRCRIIGGGPDRQSLSELAEMLRLDGVVDFVGPLTHQQVAHEYARADVFVQASVVLADGDRDGIPNALLEAMASGLPSVATRVSGIPEALSNGVNGILVEPADPVALARALARIADEPGLAASLGAAARATVVERFDRNGCARQLAPHFWPSSAAGTPAGTPA